MTQRDVEKDDENTLLDEDLAHLDQQNKDEDVQEVLSQIGLEHPITHMMATTSAIWSRLRHCRASL